MAIPAAANNPFLRLMTQAVQVERWTGLDAYGAPVYSAPETVQCRHRQQPSRLQTTTGITIIAIDVVWCPPDTGLKAEDRVTLPDGRVTLFRHIQEAPDDRGFIYAQRGACY